MHLEGLYALNINRANVWDFISDPQKFGPCLPELQSLEVIDSKTFKVKVKVGIAFVRGSMKFDFILPAQDPPAYIKYEGKGKGAGTSVNLAVEIHLSEKSPETTELSWVANAEFGGLLGEMSESLVQKSTTKFTQQFFENVKSKLEAK
jgi:carbon monoxide dehydrogenase subunit G